MKKLDALIRESADPERVQLKQDRRLIEFWPEVRDWANICSDAAWDAMGRYRRMK